MSLFRLGRRFRSRVRGHVCPGADAERPDRIGSRCEAGPDFTGLLLHRVGGSEGPVGQVSGFEELEHGFHGVGSGLYGGR